jgi:hypothetical protein
VLARGVALLSHGRMECLLLDELNIDSLFNAMIYYLCFVSFLFVVRSYIKYRPIYIYSISQYVISDQIFDVLAHELTSWLEFSNEPSRAQLLAPQVQALCLIS